MKTPLIFSKNTFVICGCDDSVVVSCLYVDNGQLIKPDTINNHTMCLKRGENGIKPSNTCNNNSDAKLLEEWFCDTLSLISQSEKKHLNMVTTEAQFSGFHKKCNIQGANNQKVFIKKAHQKTLSINTNTEMVLCYSVFSIKHNKKSPHPATFHTQ